MSAEVNLTEKSVLKESCSLWEKTLKRKRPSSWKVGELRLFLTLRGEDTTGKKADLQKKGRAFGDVVDLQLERSNGTS